MLEIIDLIDILEDHNLEEANNLNQFSIQKINNDKNHLFVLYDNYLEDNNDNQLINDKEILYFYLFENEVDFDFELLSKKATDNNELFVIFKDWNHERRTFDHILNTAKSAQMKKNVKTLFETFNPIYRTIPKSINLTVDNDGINFVEQYTNSDKLNDLKAYIYNLDMLELYKLFNITGNSLFKRNVRLGIQNKSVGKNLKLIFEKYIIVGLIIKLEKVNYDKEIVDKYKMEIREKYQLSDEDFNQFHPDNFWFCHNGINVFLTPKSNFHRERNEVKFNPNFASVINGAQTLTNFYTAYDDVIKFYKSVATEKISLEEAKLFLEDVIKQIKVKSIFIIGNNNSSKTITRGLNTQIPITDTDFIADSKMVENINKILKPYQFKILKTGELSGLMEGLTPLNFIKFTLIIEQQPGKSKNFNKNNLEDEFTRLNNNEINFKNLFDNNQLNYIMYINKNWKKIIENKKVEKIDVLEKYGKNYFQSFTIYLMNKLKERDKFLTYDELPNIYFYFQKSFSSVQNNISYNHFKNDNLYDEIINHFEKEDLSKYFMRDIDNIDKNLEDLKNSLINNKITAEYNDFGSFANLIKSHIINYNDEHKIHLEPDFKVLISKDGNIQNEIALLPASFSEFYEKYNYTDNDSKPKFEESNFYKVIQNDLVAYVIELDDQIERIKFNSEISITHDPDWKKKAEDIYNKTFQAFKEADSSLFPDRASNTYFLSNQLNNSEDTFEFTNGEKISNKTFHIHRKYIDVLINN